MAVDWLAIRNDYINGNGTYRELAEKYEVSFSAIEKKSRKEGWRKEKEEQCDSVASQVRQETKEKISEALSEEAAMKVRLRSGLLKMAVDWLNKQNGIKSTADFRRMVQSCIELGVMNVDEGADIEDDGLLAALGANAASLFDDGDDSGMLPEGKEE